jgi:hypothetical protein
MFREGLWLVDIEQAAIDIILERNKRQGINHARAVRGDYLSLLANEDSARRFVREVLGGRRMDLIALHHSMYYAPRGAWMDLIAAKYSHIPASGGMHGSGRCTRC